MKPSLIPFWISFVLGDISRALRTIHSRLEKAMSEKPKMADVFELPLARTQHLSEAIPNFGIDDGIEAEIVPFQLEEDQAEAIVRAVNDHDEMRGLLKTCLFYLEQHEKSRISLSKAMGTSYKTPEEVTEASIRTRKLLGDR